MDVPIAGTFSRQVTIDIGPKLLLSSRALQPNHLASDSRLERAWLPTDHNMIDLIRLKVMW